MKLAALLISLLLIASCASPDKKIMLGGIESNLNADGIPFDFTPEELTKNCKAILAETEMRIKKIANRQLAKNENPLLKLEDELTAFDVTISPYYFVNSVHTDENVRKSSLGCQKQTSDLFITLFTDEKLYNVIKESTASTDEEKRLKKKMLLDFEENGLKLPKKKLNKVKKLLKELSKLSTDFRNNIKEDKSKIYLTEKEMEGLPPSVMERYKKGKDGKYEVTTSYPHIIGIYNYAKSSAVRKKVYIMRNSRAPENKKVLKKVLKLRKQIARLFGKKNWAQYKTMNGRMAKNDKEIWSFINGLKSKLRQGARNDIQKLRDLKRELGHGSSPIQIWDVGYYSELYKKNKFKLDSEKVREYFPSDFVVEGMFEIYSKLLGVEFKEIGGDVWHDTVNLYKIVDKKSGKEVAYFYTDFIPREGKYSHAAAFTLRPGKRLPDGSYVKPISAIVANFNPATETKPSLLSHGEVETLFHEFGHIMHQTLTKAPFAYLSGSSVERDFVEAPSQMLEEWVWSEDILNILSGHYEDTDKKLPKEMLNRLLEMKKFNLAYGNTRQLFYGTVDMTFHSKPVQADLSKVVRDLSYSMTGLRLPKETHFETSFGHLMGYSAGYYGYLWSKVYAIDMFSLFKDKGLMNEEIGMRYRKEILEPGSMRDANDHLKAFLKRGPKQEPFYEWLGL